jgi:ABC-2 type transport system permease protein
MWAMIVKEFRQVRRDHRTLAMLIVLPILLLVVFGYAASFNVDTIPTTVVGPQAQRVADSLQEPFIVEKIDESAGRSEAEIELRDGNTPVAFVTTDSGTTTVLMDGSEPFTATAAQGALAGAGAGAQSGEQSQVEVLYNPDLATSAVMIPGLAGLVLLFIGTLITSLGVVRERQAGTLEQLAVMPLRPRDVFLGKIAPYFIVASLDLVIILTVGVTLFDVPFNGSWLVLALGSLLFLFVTLGVGVLISIVSQNQGQAIQLAIMSVLPQIILSGLIFPLESMAAGVRWISYLLPLTYFNQIARGVMLRGAPIESLWQPFLFLSLLAVVVVMAATLRFRRQLAPPPPRERKGRERKGAALAGAGAPR